MIEVKWWSGPDANNIQTEWVTLRGTDYLAAIRECDEARAELAKVTQEVSEWVCESCLMCYPGPPQPGVKCVICPKCSGNTMPHETYERRKAEAERDSLRAAVEKHNAKVEHYEAEHDTDYMAFIISLPPSAAPAASEPRDLSDMCHPECVLHTGHAGDCKLEGDAEAGAGQVYCPRCHDYECICVQQTTSLPKPRKCSICGTPLTPYGDGYLEGWNFACKCHDAAPPPAQPEEGK